MPEAVPFSLPFDEAIAFFQQKGFAISPASWRDVWQTEHARAFTVARVTAMDVLHDIKAEVDKAISTGVSLAEFKKNLIPMLERKGWFAPKGEAAKVEMPDGKIRKRLTPWRLETIYRTNIQTAYAAGRYQQQMETAAHRPYWQYKAIMDSRTRPEHGAMNNKVYDYRHPIWNTWYPPNGFRCRCYIKTLSEGDMRARGLEASIEPPGAFQPDEGWRYNVGEAGLYGIDDSRATPAVFSGEVTIEGPKTFRDYGRPAIAEVGGELRSPLPERVPTVKELMSGGMSLEAARTAVRQEFRNVFGIPSGEEGTWVKDYEGMDLRVNMGLLEYQLSKAEGREAFMRFMKATIEDPFEVWIVDDLEKQKIRKRYIGLFEKNYLVVADRYREGWGTWNAYPISQPGKVDKQREGTLIFGK